MLSWLTEEIDSRPLGLARMVVGGAAAIRAVVTWPILLKLSEPDTLRAPFAGWLPEPTLWLAIAIVLVWFITAVAFLLGWRVAWSGPLLLAAIVVTLSLDQQAYSNHLYLMAWLVMLMTLADAGASLSIEGVERRVVRWPVLLIMAQASLVYGFSGITKLNTDFLSGRVLAGVIQGGVLPFPDSLRTPDVLSILAAAVVITELFLALFLWRPSFRPAAFVLGLGLHAGITAFMGATDELLVFSIEMLALYPLFLSRDQLFLRWNSECNYCAKLVRRLEKFDLLRAIRQGGEVRRPAPPGATDSPKFELVHAEKVTRDFKALTRVLEHLVPWLWVAPIFRLPGLSHLGARILHRLARGDVRASRALKSDSSQ